MTNEDGTVQLVFNGEIYNFQEPRSELLRAGHRFVSRTDSEVLVHGYEQWGDGVVDRLCGMFAFAIWDAPKRRLFLARDPMGLKPLYYWWDAHGGFYFASEIKAFLGLLVGSVLPWQTVFLGPGRLPYGIYIQGTPVIEGTIRSTGRPFLPLKIFGKAVEVTVEGILATGFDGFLCLDNIAERSCAVGVEPIGQVSRRSEIQQRLR